MSRVLVPLATGFEEIEAVSIIDILRRAEIEVFVASLTKESLVTGANGITLSTNMHINTIDVESIDMIVLPGGWDGTYLLADDENVQRLLKAMDAKGKSIAAICAAPYALNKAGVLKEHYTCYPSVEDEIQKDGYQGNASMIVESDNVITSRGPATAICFALTLVKKLKGEAVAKSIKEGTLADYCSL